jgi:uncharacterized UPF0160 family protein
MKKKNQKKIRIITHDGSYHADDVFACATLLIYLKKKGKNVQVIRTREKTVIESGDYVFDLGGIHNPAKNRFDHHQLGGAGKRKNGIPYAAFGLVWKKFGHEVSGDRKVAEMIDKHLVEPIDGPDNGFDYFKPTLKDSFPYKIQEVFAAFAPSWKENISTDVPFLKCVSLAIQILEREIKKNKDVIEAERIMREAYQRARDKRIVVLDIPFPRFDVVNILDKHKKTIYAVYPTRDKNDWRIVGLAKTRGSHRVRKPFPKSWGGMADRALQKITGVKDAKNFHRMLFLGSAFSKEGAVKLAQLALRAK